MNLRDELRHQLQTFAEGKTDERTLFAWLGGAGRLAPELHTPGAESLRRVVGKVYIVLSELGYGDRTAESVRNEVETLLCQADTPKMRRAGEPDTIIPGVSPRPS
jgi:hypothetical protein